MKRIKAYMIYDDYAMIVDPGVDYNLINIIPITINEDLSINSIEVSEEMKKNKYLMNKVTHFDPSKDLITTTRYRDAYNRLTPYDAPYEYYEDGTGKALYRSEMFEYIQKYEKEMMEDGNL